MPTATATRPLSVLEINALADAVEVAKDLTVPFVTDDISTYKANYGIRLDLAAKAFVYSEEPLAEHQFIRNLHAHCEKGNDLSQKQARAALNILREHVRNLKPTRKYHEEPEFDPEFGGNFLCYRCMQEGIEERFEHMHDLLAHKKEKHGYEPQLGSKDGAILNPISVLEYKIETTVDLSELRDGWYAFPHDSAPPNNDGMFFFRVRRTREDKEVRNRRFQYGKRIVGQEIVPEGTIEVRFLSGDTKELVGDQKPGSLYKGQYAQFLEEIASDDRSQRAHASLYAVVSKKCSICNKALTDKISRNDRMGPECVKRWKADYYRNMTAAQIHAENMKAYQKGEDDSKDDD